MKTIFYKRSDDDTGDYYFNDRPYKEWFVLENTLYDPNGNISRNIIDDKGFLKSISLTSVIDRFTDEGIIRRIAVYIP